MPQTARGDSELCCPRCGGTGKVMMESVTVGDIIEQTRKAKGVTQAELTPKAAISRGQLANIEGGRSDVPMNTLKRIADALGVSMKDLVP